MRPFFFFPVFTRFCGGLYHRKCPKVSQVVPAFPATIRPEGLPSKCPKLSPRGENAIRPGHRLVSIHGRRGRPRCHGWRDRRRESVRPSRATRPRDRAPGVVGAHEKTAPAEGAVGAVEGGGETGPPPFAYSTKTPARGAAHTAICRRGASPLCRGWRVFARVNKYPFAAPPTAIRKRPPRKDPTGRWPCPLLPVGCLIRFCPC